MATVPNQIWTEVRVYPLTAAKQLREALMQYHDAIKTDNKATLIWNPTDDIILIINCYCAPVENPSVFQPFYSIPHLTNFVPPGVRTIYDLVQIIASMNEAEPTVHEFRTMSSRHSVAVYEAIEKAHAEQAELLKVVEGLALTSVIQSRLSLAMNQTLKHGGSTLGLEPVGQQCTSLYGGVSALQVFELCGAGSGSLGALRGGECAAVEGGCAEYDLEGVFRSLQNGGWLLSKS
ncbi:hypothetical protein BO70DRAFT_397790 [Aspergillus heteromorphus CBS 117.55]|uniref:Uncharacterized protein n=1 Tax=Aspergillus heteromorphus CBS 117.55 TaxID=1448321 RepID=A0A317VT11_9EURO|nr:uncharacterized protein BO70DRAFT_397790 [Aspergillus heteromorphus CBS 117.55]PWY77504.1 hypothetical protein BO70DRAFT_397790 [Aspergillus heteromorphus CBS 117.55]